MNPLHVVTIQHAADSGLYHPTLYRERPFPGPPDYDKPTRYVVAAHHTEGFESLADARADCQVLLDYFGISSPLSGVQVQEVEFAGPGVVLTRSVR